MKRISEIVWAIRFEHGFAPATDEGAIVAWAATFPTKKRGLEYLKSRGWKNNRFNKLVKVRISTL